MVEVVLAVPGQVRVRSMRFLELSRVVTMQSEMQVSGDFEPWLVCWATLGTPQGPTL